MKKIVWQGGVSCTLQNEQKVPSYAGVYVITEMDGKIRYVGQANDLQRRFCEHLYESEKNTALRNFVQQKEGKFFWIQVPDKEDRNGIELFIYREVSPILNDVAPCGKVAIPIYWG